MAGQPAARRLTRRRFMLAVASVAGGGLTLTWATRDKDSLAEGPDVLEPNAFLQITPAGEVIFQLDKVEMGQGTMTGLLTLVAEELDLDPARFEVRFAPVRNTFKRPMQMTGQSKSMVDSWDVLRETGAAARAMLLAAAAQQWGVAETELRSDNGVVSHPDMGLRATYAELAAPAAALSPPWSVKLKDPSQYRWIGGVMPRRDIPDKVTGAAIYGIDVQLDGMLTAVIARCPQLGATLTGFDSRTAETMPGVRGFVPLAGGVAVVADNYWAAQQAAQQLRLDWQPGPLAETSDAEIGAGYSAQFDRIEPDYMRSQGDSAVGIEDAERVLEVEYHTPYLAHAPMESLNATVQVQADRCEVWVSSQAPDMVQSIVAATVGLPREQVIVHTTYIGGGFGRRVLWDYALEAALVAKEYAVPVKTVWPREDDIQHGYFRQRTAHRLRAGLSPDGEAVAWEHRQVAAPTAHVLMPPTMHTLLPQFIAADTRARIGEWMADQMVHLLAAFQAREGAETLIYAIPDMSFAQYAHDAGVPVSIWRSVGNSYNGFVVESFIDELAFSAGADPAAYRRKYLRDARHIKVLDTLLEQCSWGKAPSGRAQGVALFESFGTVVGQVAEVSIDNSADANARAQTIRVHRVTCVVDCGRAVTPDIVHQQMQSGIVFGLTAALYGEINIDAGRVRQSNFHDYPMVKMHDAPAIDVHIIASALEPSGVGEPGVPPIAPAVANAVFALTGKRLRSLPLRFSS